MLLSIGSHDQSVAMVHINQINLSSQSKNRSDRNRAEAMKYKPNLILLALWPV